MRSGRVWRGGGITDGRHLRLILQHQAFACPRLDVQRPTGAHAGCHDDAHDSFRALQVASSLERIPRHRCAAALSWPAGWARRGRARQSRARGEAGEETRYTDPRLLVASIAPSARASRFSQVICAPARPGQGRIWYTGPRGALGGAVISASSVSLLLGIALRDLHRDSGCQTCKPPAAPRATFRGSSHHRVDSPRSRVCSTARRLQSGNAALRHYYHAPQRHRFDTTRLARA